jgi:hypothetical protein
VVSFEGCPGTVMDAVAEFLVAERQRLRGETLHREAAMEAGLPLLPALHCEEAAGAGARHAALAVSSCVACSAAPAGSAGRLQVPGERAWGRGVCEDSALEVACVPGWTVAL